MHSFYVDGSALAKRFVPEQGSSNTQQSALLPKLHDEVPSQRAGELATQLPGVFFGL
jgi:hypothetical protein